MKLSVVIPCFNEEKYLTKLLESLVQHKTDLHEIIVVDGGSRDKTIAIAEKYNCTVLSSSVARRSVQLDLGGKVASGNILLFVHADSILPEKFASEIEAAVVRGSSVGCFRLKFNPSTPFLRFFEIFVGLPWLICRGGDQGLFISQKLYKQIGGYNVDLHIMEDVDIVRKAVKFSRFSILQQRLKTSSRAYKRYGEIKLQFSFGLVHLAYWLGINTEVILYRLNKFLNNE